jgi:hypothetical protein
MLNPINGGQIMKIKIRVPTSFPCDNLSPPVDPDKDPYMYIIWFVGNIITSKDQENFYKLTR